MASKLFATKPLSLLLEEMQGENRLRRILGPVQLTALGVGAIIGTGIFILTGVAAHDRTGPALMLSFVMAGLACVFAALCYAEFASMVPVAGSAYTYAYATLGELFAWMIGWDLVLEYAVGAATVANGWSGYFQSVLLKIGLVVPVALSGAPHKYDQGHLLPNLVAEYDKALVTVQFQDKEGKSQPVLGKEDKAEVTQKVMDGKKALWADGSTKAAEGIFWVLSKKAGEKTVVVGQVGESTVESKLQNHQRAVINLPAIIVVLLVTA